MEQTILVLTNVPDEALARSMAQALVEQRLVACVNIMPAVASVYRWEGRVAHADEVMLIIKTTQSCYAAVESAIVESHPYDVPEVVAVPVTAGLPGYMQWVATQTEKE